MRKVKGIRHAFRLTFGDFTAQHEQCKYLMLHDPEIQQYGELIAKLMEILSLPIYIYTCIILAINLSLCCYFDHKFVSEDYGNSESGYMGCSCSRCGEETGQQLF